MNNSTPKSLSLTDGSTIDPAEFDLWDSVATVEGSLNRAFGVVSTLLMIDEVLLAGKSVKKTGDI